MSKKLSIYLVVSFLIITVVFNSTQIVNSEENEYKTIYVDDGGRVQFKNIQDAINFADSGDTIYVHNGTYYENIVLNKSISLIGEDKNSTIINANFSGIVVNILFDRVNLSGFTIKNSGNGIKTAAIYIESDFNRIFNNKIENNNECGIFLWGSNKNKIFKNFISDNKDDGIYLGKNSSYNRIYDNVILKNNFSGIYIGGSVNNTILDNALENNGWDGISLYSNSDNNNIIRNNITNNSKIGIRLSQSSNNFIYQNNFINNTDNAYDEGNNAWYNESLKMGNYWDDYAATDDNGDGIGDSTYNVPGGDNQDLYPIMSPYYKESKGENQIDEEALFFMLLVGLILVTIFVLPIAYYWRKKHYK